MGGASFGTQANALLRKSAVYQKRNVCTNICLVSSPIFFCIILLVIKILVDKLLLNQSDYKCGCMCTRCCVSKSCTTDPFCKEGNCEAYSSTVCGVQYSTPAQAQWCEVTNPSVWPAMLDAPRVKYRALPARPALTTLMTAPQPPSLTFSQLYPYLYTTPSGLDNDTLLNYLIPNLVENYTYNAYLLSKYGFNFATNADTGAQFTEEAFSQTLQMLVPVTSSMSCANFSSIFPPIVNTSAYGSAPLVDALAGMVNLTSNTTVTTDQIIDAAISQGNPIVLKNLMSVSVVCTNVVFSNKATSDDMDETVYCGFQQARCNGTSVIDEYPQSYEYTNTSKDTLKLTLYYNGTDNSANDGSGRQRYQRWNLGFSGAVTSWLNVTLGGNTVAANAVRLLGLMAMPKSASRLKLDLSTLLGPLFYTWVVQMLLPTFLQLLVYEKEKRLRMMMKMHGLGDGAYWLVTYLWYLMLYIIYMAIFIIFGAGVGLENFRRTSMGMQIIFYFLFGNNMIAMSFMLSSLFSSARTSIVVAFIYIFATGLLGQLLLVTFMEQNRDWLFFVEWIPAFALYRGLWEMSQYAIVGVYRGTGGLNFDNWTDPGCGMRATWGIFVVEWFIFMLLGWYLEQVVSSGTGIRRHPLYFLSWCMPKKKDAGSLTVRNSMEMAAAPGSPIGSATNGGSGNSGLAKDGSLKMQPGEREDVRAERLRVEAMTESDQVPPIVVRDLRKVFPAQDGGKPKVAVRTLTLAIERGECFGLLGPNGAGKSTSINMLTGFLEPTSGTAYIDGLDITTQMSKIYRQMGVCPQHDLLWEQLTGEEHLYFYGRLKGLKGSDLDSAVTKALKGVNLLNGGVGRKLSGKYSGGMKRRLSVAISFIGDPQVVYLDEPSTGLDPASRRALWDVVRSNKDGRAVILTTHSMEEAEILCDRLGIFVDGQLVCVGAPREITARYAGYLVFTLTVGPGHEEAAKAFVMHISPNARLTYELGSTVKYELPTADVSLSGVFAAMATIKDRIRVLDWGVANATLEEVFIKFAKEIGAETRDQ